MQLALALGRRGLGTTWPNPAVGAVIVRKEDAGPVVVGRGWTQPGGRPHAEIEALRRAGEAARGATLYVTLEPCCHHGKSPPCVDAVIGAGLARVVSALEDPNPEVAGKGHAALRRQGIDLLIGTGAEAARRDHAGHISRLRNGRPHVTIKIAVSADGKVGLSGRRPAAITGLPAQHRVHLMRAMADAVLVGIGTAIADDPLLNCRLPGMAARSPVRIVLDAQLRLSPQRRLVKTAHTSPVWVVAGESASDQQEQVLRLEGVEIMRVKSMAGTVDLHAALKAVAARGITRLMVEAGPMIATGLLRQDLIDEAVIFRSPNPIGVGGIEALEGLPLAALTQSPRFRSLGQEAVGVDTVETFERV
jgi:diaminohydroxyphosphoribosylaminopyrimidine deaminase/5-amino-6-(5-phosphoribosylamino)uracil reductase